MSGRPAVAFVALLLAGCGAQAEAMPSACLGGADAVVRALAAAPAAVRLDDGTRLSGCVSGARSGGDLQALGASLISAADTIQRESDPDTAALRLGYLAGAVRAGAQASPGSIAAQLQRSIERATRLRTVTPAASAARERGLLAGERDG